ncbi:MAG: DMT family transporter [Alphaproteobacteria bacterium]|nr:DMT family transporter [Alphaproteobacteria bacterium]
MPLTVFLAVLAAALGHATWNALLKSHGKPWDNITALSYADAIVCAIALFFFPAPAQASWPFLLASGGTQFFYMYIVSKVYKKGDYAVGYPLMRGLSPPFVALFGFLVLHETMSVPELIGLACISLGVLTIGFGAIHNLVSFKKQALLALFCGLMIAYYALVDGQGARLSNSTIAYTLWVFLLQGVGVAIFRALKKQPLMVPLNHWKPWAGAVLSIAAYSVALWAMTLAPIATVAALRESSILFSALVGFLILREKPNLFRIMGAALIAAGVITFRLSF